MAEIRYTLPGGAVFVDKRDGTTLADEVAFEHQFKLPSVVLTLHEQRRLEHEAAVAAAEKAGEKAPEPDPDSFVPSEWIAFFSWRRFRREGATVPDRFEDFVEAVSDWEFLADEAPAEDDDDDKDEGEDGAAGSLDPTGPAPRPTPRRTSSSPASAGKAS